MVKKPAKLAMGREEHINMAAEETTELLHGLEMKHQQNTSQSDLLVKDEDIRRLKLRILMLRDENTSLGDQIKHNGDINAKLAAQCEGLGAQLEAKIEVVRSQEKQLRKQEREFSNLKAELQVMNNVTQDSTNVLAEKLSLTRELAVLKPELDHLRSQLTHQQATLAEKLALERQVNTLEVELANEKKATKRAMQKRESNDRVEDELRKELREAEKQLTAEKAQRERLEDQLAEEKRTHQLALQDQDSTRELESDLRKKLQEATKQLREANEEKEQLEEELQAEKRQTKKASKKQSNNSADDELRTKLEEVEKKLAAEQKTREKIQVDAQNDLVEATRRADGFEKKFEKLKTKYRELQEQLKQCQADLKKAQQMQLSLSNDGTKKSAGSQVFRKRKAQEMTAEDITSITIETPGADNKPHRRIKQRSFEPTLVGEKSTFSITPFLNKSKNAEEDNTTRPDDAEDGEVEDSILGVRESARKVEVVTTTVPVAPADDNTTSSIPSAEPSAAEAEVEAVESEKPEVKSRGRPKKVLGEAPSAKKNALPKKKSLKKTPKLGNTLEKVTEEGEESQESNAAATEKTQTVKFDLAMPQDTSTSSANTSKSEETKKKKRKVLGSKKTLFDDEETEPEASVRKKGKAQGGAKKTLLNGPRNAFASAKTFSPLKKDRRGVGASFLG